MEFAVGEFKYKSRKLNAFDQLFIVRRLAGTINGVLTQEVVQSLASKDAKDPLRFLEAFSKAISNLKDEDLVFILNKCCGVCMRQQGQNYVPMMNGDAHMFMDISGPQMLQIAYNVLSEDLGSFFDEFRSILGRAGLDLT